MKVRPGSSRPVSSGAAFSCSSSLPELTRPQTSCARRIVEQTLRPASSYASRTTSVIPTPPVALCSGALSTNISYVSSILFPETNPLSQTLTLSAAPKLSSMSKLSRNGEEKRQNSHEMWGEASALAATLNHLRMETARKQVELQRAQQVFRSSKVSMDW